MLTTIPRLSGTDLGLGLGGMERMNAYSFIVWLLGFSSFLMNKSSFGAIRLMEDNVKL